MALIAAVFAAFGTILLKRLVILNIDYTYNMIYAAYLGIPITLVLSILFRVLEIENKSFEPFLKDKLSLLWQLFFVLISSASQIISQVFLNIALKYEDPAKVSIIRINDLFITFVLQTLLLNIYSNFFSILGSLLIFTSTFLVIFYKILYNKYNKNDPNQSCCKKCFFYKL